jgi:F-type H+-transporting ATPase subunit c
MKRSLIRVAVSFLTVAFSAVGALAQTPEVAKEGSFGGRGLGYLAAVVGFAIAAGLCGLGQGRVAAAACEGMARNPSAYNRVQLALILGLAFIETLVIFTFVVVLLKVPNAPNPY